MAYDYRTKLTLYHTTYLNETENFIIDSINDYLSSTAYTPNYYVFTIPPRSISLDMSIKVQWTSYETFILEQFNYAKLSYIQLLEGTETINKQKDYYFFVRKINRIADGTIEVVLHMDVINTFKPMQGTSANDFEFSSQTIIKREHKNRFVYDSLTNKWNIQSIDRYQEGINPQLFRQGAPDKYDDVVTAVAKDFYLIYKNSLADAEDANNVVDCFLACTEKITYSYNAEGPTFTPDMLLENKYYYFFADSCTFRATDKYTGVTFGNMSTVAMIRVKKEGNILIVNRYRYNNSQPVNPPYSNSSVEDSDVHIVDYFILTSNDKYYESNNLYYERRNAYENSIEKIASSSVVTGTSKSYSEINKTDSRIIKIIKIPYAPTAGFSVTGNVITFDPTKWEYDPNEQLLRLVDLNVDFLNQFVRVPYRFGTSGMFPVVSTPSLMFPRNDDYEAKIYHSEFYQLKYLYDSFSLDVKLEQVDITRADQMYVHFRMTKTINSRFMFDFDNYDFNFAEADFPHVLIVQRNNEEVIYNSPYINYLRAGFNYDVKAKNRQEAMTWFTTAMGMLAGGLNVAFGSKTLGVGMIASSVLSLGNAINTTLTAEQNLQARVNQLKMQSNSVYGADDVDLMSDYAKNKLLRVIYTPSPRMKKLILDLFYYTGYAENKMAIPDVTTRSWFNFLACELKIKKFNIPIPSDCLEELIAKYNGGVTFFHMHIRNVNIKMWDMERSSANLESAMF